MAQHGMTLQDMTVVMLLAWTEWTGLKVAAPSNVAWRLQHSIAWAVLCKVYCSNNGITLRAYVSDSVAGNAGSSAPCAPAAVMTMRVQPCAKLTARLPNSRLLAPTDSVPISASSKLCNSSCGTLACFSARLCRLACSKAAAAALHAVRRGLAAGARVYMRL